MIPSASDIQYFLEVAKTGNISRAAERLGIRQPSVSEALKRLEHCVGQKLLVRSRQGVSLTKAGELFRQEGRELIQKWESIRSRIDQSQEELSGQFSIGCHASVGLYTLKSVVPQLLKAHSKLVLRMEHDLSRKITESVISRRLDLGIVVNPVEHPDLVIRNLFEDQVGLWATPKAPKDVLICDPELAQTQFIIGKLSKSGMRFERVLTVPSLEVICSLVEAGAGTGVIPSRVARAFGASKMREVSDGPVFKDRVCLIYRADLRGSGAAMQLTSEVFTALAEK